MPRKPTRSSRRRICFVTGTRAEFGLMQTVLKAIQADARLQLQIVVTGMHLDRRHGRTIDEIRKENWPIDAVVDWPKQSRASATGLAISHLTKVFERLKPEIVLIVGDRVEAFAAATAAHLCDIAVAHVHGGDRALGQMDDSLRHAISKLAHVHFPATKQSARRLEKMGEDKWRIHCMGSPGLDGVAKAAASSSQIRTEFPGLRPHRFALVVQHPIDADESLEFRRAKMISSALRSSNIEHIVVIYPNSDPGAGGIIRHWQTLSGDKRFLIRPDIPRPLFLGLLRDAAMLVGNSSSGIIEAASFSTHVIDIGPRQQGRERCKDVRNVPYRESAIAAVVRKIWNNARPRRGRHHNIYAQPNTGKSIAEALRKLEITPPLLRKIISY
jgi:GDP/UDP-N,N'-diacetylbacillosamine 2-epimerase (hydrolysing)